MLKHITSITLLASYFICCNPKTDVNTESYTQSDTLSSSVKEEPYGKMPDGKLVSVFTLTNATGMTMRVINYGGIITSLTMPDRNGNMADIVLGYDSLGAYLKSNPYFGALIGRYGNRIAKGKFSLDENAYQLDTNNNGNHLHGGDNGFDKVFWNIAEHKTAEGPALKLTYESADMEEGYPGKLNVEVIYTLTNSNELKIDYTATTDKKTIVNLTQHSYFNLSGGTTDILSHQLLINADHFLPVDKTLIPTGELKPVEGTPFDFTSLREIGSRINEDNEQLKYGNGYDHNWVLNKATEGLHHAATLFDPSSGREVTVHTTEPGIQFYSGNFLDGSLTGKRNTKYNFRTGLCLETQHFPDSPNQSKFPSVVLTPGEKYSSHTVYRFSVR